MPDASTSSALRSGAVCAAVAVAVGLVVSTVLVAVAGVDGIGPTLRTGVRAWLVAQGSGLQTGSISVGIVPWGGLLVVGALAYGVARWAVRDARVSEPAPTATRRTTRTTTPEPQLELPAFAASAAGTAGLLAAVLSAVTSTSGTSTSIVRSAFAAFVVTGVGVALGAAHAVGRTDQLWPTARPDVRTAVVAGFRAALALVGVGAVLVIALLGLHAGRAVDLWGLLAPGVGGGLGLALLCLALVPTAALWSVAVMLGPGFALGTDTSVDLSGAQLGPVPGLPLLAALPSPGSFGGIVVVLGLVPVLAGAWAGWSAVSRLAQLPAPGTEAGASPTPDLGRDTVQGLSAGAVAGVIIGLLVGGSGGSVGPGRLADAGPPVLSTLLLAVVVLAVGGAIGGALAHYRGRRAADDPTDPDRGPGLGERDEPAGTAGRDAGSFLRRLGRRGRE